MVLYSNINVNQRVEVRLDGQILRGIVKYKGSLASQPGDWVGVALEEPLGKHDGMIKGRRYFACKNLHGIFVRANNVRFIPMTRCLYNKYRTVSHESYFDDTLFARKTSPEVRKANEPPAISGLYKNKANTLFEDSFDMYERPKSYLKSHLVGHHLPAATMTRPYTSASMTSRPHSVASFTRPYSTSFSPVHSEYALDREEFIRSPSIPACHMPYEALKQQVKRGWDTAHYVREMSVPTGRDSIKYSQWNDISA